MKRKYNLNEDFFSIIDTEEKAYWFGFILADDCILKHTRKNGKFTLSFELTLCEKDKNHVELFKNSIGCNNPTIERIMPMKWIGGGNKYYRIAFGSRKFVEDLINLGCGYRKSLNLTFPNTVPKNFINHFIRGYIDGDGCFYETSNTICCSMMGTKEFLEDILKNTPINQTTGIYSKRNDGKNSYYLQIKRNKRCKLLYHFLYDNATIYMDRKREVIKNYFKL